MRLTHGLVDLKNPRKVVASLDCEAIARRLRLRFEEITPIAVAMAIFSNEACDMSRVARVSRSKARSRRALTTVKTRKEGVAHATQE